MTTDHDEVPKKTKRRKPKKARSSLQGQKPALNAKRRSTRKQSAKRAGALSMQSLPGAPMRIPDGLKERAERPAQTRSSAAPVPAKPRRPAAPSKALQLNVERLIEALPRQSMGNLRQQWLNLQNMIAKVGRHKGLKRFETALLAEWERRHHLAVNDPDHFDWPSTEAGRGDGTMPFENWHSEGMLAFLGYRVGSTQGVGDQVRRQILNATFASVLPPVNDRQYLREWAGPSSALRLRRLANEIARFARNAKRKRSANMESAIADWEDDLHYLHREFYVGKFGFGWPTTTG
ncbi:MAG: hypothetical protein ABIV36_00835 [Sphingobium limneticum]